MKTSLRNEAPANPSPDWEHPPHVSLRQSKTPNELNFLSFTDDKRERVK